MDVTLALLLLVVLTAVCIYPIGFAHGRQVERDEHDAGCRRAARIREGL